MAIFLVLTVRTAAPASSQMTINSVEVEADPAAYANRISAFVTVTGEDHAPIDGLSSSQFTILEDGRPVVPDAVSQATDPMWVVMAIDTSGSMQATDASGRSAMEAARESAADFISRLAAEDRVAVYTFNTVSQLLLDFTDDHLKAAAEVSAIRAVPNAATCLYDTAMMAVKKAAEIPKGRRAVILLTDGRDEKGGGPCSTFTANDVIDAASTRSIRLPLYTIGVGPRVDARLLARMAQLTGGRRFLARDIGDLATLYQLLSAQLKSQYRIHYLSRSASGEHSLVVKTAVGGAAIQDEKRFWEPPLPEVPRPQVRFLSPAQGASVDGQVGVKVLITPEDVVERVLFYVDSDLVTELTRVPTSPFYWDAGSAAPGLHLIRVEAVDITGRSTEAEMTLIRPSPETAATTAAPEKPAAPAPSEPEKAFPVLPVVGVLVIAAVAVFLVIRRRRQACEPSREPAGQAVIEDETVFMADDDAAAVTAPPARLVVEKSLCLDMGHTFSFTGSITAGRSEDNTIHIPDKPVSRKHAEIVFQDGQYVIHDLGSRNGIKIDGNRIGLERTPLKTGAKISFGPRTVLTFYCESDSPVDDRTRRYGE